MYEMIDRSTDCYGSVLLQLVFFLILVPYLVPVEWKGRTDWQQALFLTDTQTKVIVQLKNNPEKQLQFSKHMVALDEQTNEDDIIMGMEVVVKVGVDDKQLPYYSPGTIVDQLRRSQYNVTLRKSLWIISNFVIPFIIYFLVHRYVLLNETDSGSQSTSVQGDVTKVMLPTYSTS